MDRGWNLKLKTRKSKWETWKTGKAIYEERVCICGCNNKFKCKIISKQKFIHGHNSRVKKYSNREGLKKGHRWNKGLTKESDKRIFEASIKLSKAHKGRHSGSNSNLWKGGITSIQKIIRGLDEYDNWRKQVFERDKYTCQECSEQGGKLEAHHKKEFHKIFKEFLNHYSQFSPIEDKNTLVRLSLTWLDFWNLNNGQTLCKKCHNKTKRGAHYGS